MNKTKQSKQTAFKIQDWAGNLIKFDGRPYLYASFDDAEEVLAEELDGSYEIDREKYHIVEVPNE